MTWRAHIENNAKLCYIRLRALYSIRESFTEEQLKTLGSSLILSVLNYMLVVVGATSKKYIKIMDKVLRTLARLILRIKKYDAVAERILHDLKWLFTGELYHYKLLCIIFRICKLNEVPYFYQYFVKNGVNHTYNMRGKGKLLYLYKPRLDNGKNLLQYNGVKLWNQLPENIRTIEKYANFKKELLNYMISKDKL